VHRGLALEVEAVDRPVAPAHAPGDDRQVDAAHGASDQRRDRIGGGARQLACAAAARE
jgi:hypothetical protein